MAPCAMQGEAEPTKHYEVCVEADSIDAANPQECEAEVVLPSVRTRAQPAERRR
jgi:hypothetical protein